jgi:hypothetical protein
LQPDLTAAFPTFATRFLDGEIDWAGGTAITSQHLSNFEPQPFTVPDTPAGLFNLKFPVTPWNIEKAEITTFQPDQIVSIVFNVDEPDDTMSILQYRRTGDSVWQVLNPGETADLQNTDTTTCPLGPSEWTFLVTSTFDPSLGIVDHDGFVHSTVSFSSTQVSSKRDNSCNPNQPPSPPNGTNPVTDQCLVGSWNLDIPSMQDFLTQQMSTLSSASISNLVVGGSSTFDVTDSFSSTMTFADLTIGYDGEAGGYNFHTDIDITGTVTGDLTLDGTTATSFTWTKGESTGQADTTTTVTGLGDSIPLDVDLGQDYGGQTDVQYTCSGNTLQMLGYVGGQFTWAYTWTKD